MLTVLRNNAVAYAMPVPAHTANYTWALPIAPPSDGGVDRWRAELRDEPSKYAPRTLTNHIFVHA